MSYRRIPSRKTLVAAFGSEKGNKVRRLLDGRDSADDCPAVQSWVSQCYHEPRHDEKIECAVNEALGGFGTEAIRASNAWDHSGYYGDIVAGYVNMGDTYSATVLFDYDRDAVYVTSWGDWVETSERTRRYKFE